MKDRDYRNGTRNRIKGPGTTTSDSIPAMLSKGEYVIKASSAAKLGDKALNHMNKTGSIPRKKFALGGKAKIAAWAAGVGVPTGYLGYKAYSAADRLRGAMDERNKTVPASMQTTPPPQPAPEMKKEKAMPRKPMKCGGKMKHSGAAGLRKAR